MFLFREHSLLKVKARIQMTFLALLILLLSTLTDIVNSLNSTAVTEEKDYIEIIKNFALCPVQCNGKVCECCQKIQAPLNVEDKVTTVCGISLLRTAEKTVDLTLKIDGDDVANTSVKLDHLLNFCIPVKTKGGELGICIITTLVDNKSDPNAIDACVTVNVSVSGVDFARASFNCGKFDGEIQIEGETDKKGLKTFGSVKVVNGGQLATFVHKLVFGK